MLSAKRLRGVNPGHVVEDESVKINEEYSEENKYGNQGDKFTYKKEKSEKIHEVDGFGAMKIKEKEKACKCITGKGCNCVSPPTKVKKEIVVGEEEF